MTYRLPYAVAGRASHGDDVHAGYSPWPSGPRGGAVRLTRRPRRAFQATVSLNTHIVELTTYALWVGTLWERE